MNTSPPQFRLGIALAVLSACGFASKAIFVKLAYLYGVDAITLLTLRLSYTTLIIWLIWFIRRSVALSIGWKDGIWLVFLGLITYVIALMDFQGLQTVSAGLERMILSLYPTFTVLLSALLTGNRISRRIAQALPLTYLGIALVMVPELQAAHGDLLGVMLILGSTIGYALYLTWSPAVIARIGAMRFTELALTVSGMAMLAHFLLIRPPVVLIQQQWQVHGYAFVMALLATALPIYALAHAMRLIGSGRAAVVSSFGPLLTIMMSMGVLDERFSLLQWLGVVMVLSGVWWVSSRK